MPDPSTIVKAQAALGEVASCAPAKPRSRERRPVALLVLTVPAAGKRSDEDGLTRLAAVWHDFRDGGFLRHRHAPPAKMTLMTTMSMREATKICTHTRARTLELFGRISPYPTVVWVIALK
jgi:hypothetical protein